MRRDRVGNRWDRICEGSKIGRSPIKGMQPKNQINGILVREMKKKKVWKRKA